jgi:hypothetical protein
MRGLEAELPQVWHYGLGGLQPERSGKSLQRALKLRSAGNNPEAFLLFFSKVWLNRRKRREGA